MTETAMLKGLAKRTEESNRAFAAATDAEKRVIIARDVIEAIKASAILPTSGVYLQVEGKYGDDALDAACASPSASFQDLLPSLPPCTVCAKGAVFVCAVARQNKVTNQEAFRSVLDWDGDTMARLLGGVFSGEQLALIEREFEGCVHDVRYERVLDDYPAMGLFEEEDEGGYREPLFDDAERMTRIMQNIIDNDGTFRPAPHPIGGHER